MLNFFKKKKQDRTQFLTPHTAKPVINYQTMPHIYIDYQAYKDMCTLIDLIDTEVGWQGIVKKVDDDFLITEIFIMGQEVHETTTILTTDGQSDLAMELFETRPDDAVELLNSLRFWGHSHVWMSVHPSSRDDAQMEEFKNNGAEYYIRGIGNKAGVMVFDLYLYNEKITVHDVPWSIVHPDSPTPEKEKWEKELSKKVKYMNHRKTKK